MVLNDPQFNKDKFIKSLESVIYLFLVIPLIGFGWVFLEKERLGELRAVVFEDPDIMFHSVMAIGVGYVLMRTLATWKRDF